MPDAWARWHERHDTLSDEPGPFMYELLFFAWLARTV